ncbi:MAG: ABC transporter ATP-binding protein [Pseudomonadota bacterium]
MSNSPALAFRGVTKAFGRTQPVLTGLDLSVPPGEFFGLVGVNGAGKTTSIKCLLDFCEPDRGEIDIFGVSHRQNRARERLAYLPEQFLPPYFLTGRAFLNYMGRLQGRKPSETECRELCEALDLDYAALGRSVRQFSKGMAQKLGLAGCFLAGRDLLILDEPMSGLDPKARVLVKQHLQRLRSDGVTVFFSTHMLFDVQELCDRMGVLHEGELRFVGSPDECCDTFGTRNLEQAYLKCISA